MFNKLFKSETATYYDPRTNDHKERAKLYDLFWRYYEGDHKRHLKAGMDNVDDNVTVNLSGNVVDTAVSFLFGKGINYETDSMDDERTDEEQYLDGIFESDPVSGFSMQDFLNEMGQMGAVTGHVFVRIHVDAEGNPTKPSVLDTSLVDVVVDPDNRKRVNEYHVTWKSGKTYTGRDMWKRQRFERQGNDTWLIHSEATTSGIWEPTEPEPEVWGYAFPPIFDCQNNKNARGFWGYSDLVNADLNDAVNKVSSDMQRIIRFHASPKTILTGAKVSDMTEISPNEMWSITNPDAKAYNLEMAGELSASANYKQALKDEFHETTRTPNLNPTNVQVGALSGFALRILYAPLISKTNSKRVLYGGLLERLMHAYLVLGGFESNRITLKWPNPLPTDDNEQAQKFAVYKQSGVPLPIAAELAGLPKEVTQGIVEAQAMNDLERKIDMLQTLSMTTNLPAAIQVIFGDPETQPAQLAAQLARTDTEVINR